MLEEGGELVGRHRLVLHRLVASRIPSSDVSATAMNSGFDSSSTPPPGRIIGDNGQEDDESDLEAVCWTSRSRCSSPFRTDRGGDPRCHLREDKPLPSTNELGRLFRIDYRHRRQGPEPSGERQVLVKRRGVGMFVAGAVAASPTATRELTQPVAARCCAKPLAGRPPHELVQMITKEASR